ncbi:YrdB family protein [Modestobacter sp. SSW1-42]|uniref:YrdB family protein n=1 Tax=Modestobacter sp. SSW1-42 TaxID=596372 RepID=UPI00398882B8
MRTGLAWADAALAFVLELVALAVLARAGHRLGGGGLPGVAPAVALPVVAAVLWARFAAPRAGRTSTGRRLAVQLLVLGGAAVLLGLQGAPGWAGLLGGVVVLNLVAAALLPSVHAPPERRP